MPWAKAKFKGGVVFAKTDAQGAFAAENGLVEIRYKVGDGRAYRARESGLERVAGESLVGDEVVGEAAPVARDEEASAGPAGAGKAGRGQTGASRAGARGGKSASNGAARSGTTPAPVAKNAFVAYTDGACSGNPGPAGLGVVVVSPSGASVEGYEYLGTATNNIAELTAIMRALENSPPESPIVVHTDSQYAIGVLTKGWKAKANQELIASIRAILKPRPGVTFVYVRGHAGVPLNERADELARTAVIKRDTQWIASKPAKPEVPAGAD